MKLFNKTPSPKRLCRDSNSRDGFVLMLILLISIFKGIRYPNDWAEAHWMIGYQFGFIKRGLPGALFNLIVKEAYQDGIVIFSILFFLIFCITLLWKGRELLVLGKANVIDYFVLVVFFSSSYITFSSHLLGYYDNIVIIAIVFSLHLICKQKLLASSLLLGIGVLVHETIIVLGLPLVTLHLFAKSEKEFRIIPVLKVCSVPIFVLAAIFVANHTKNIPGEIIESYLESFEFIGRERHILVGEAFAHSFIDYLKEQIGQFPLRILSIQGLVKVAIPCSIIVGLVWVSLEEGLQKKRLIILYILCVYSPQLLHAIAWDTQRIWSYSWINAFLGYVSIQNHFAKQKVKPVMLGILLLLCLIINCIPPSTLMDGENERFGWLTRAIILIFTTMVVFSSKRISAFFHKSGKYSK